MRRDAVRALVRYADRDVEKLLGKRVERSRGHDLLDGLPGALERRGIVGQGFPEIVDEVGLARGANIVVNRADLRRCVVVFDEGGSGP